MKVLVITDTNVRDLYIDNNFKYNYYAIPSGESNKNIKEIMKIYKACNDAKIDRNSSIIAFGGGIVGDMTGFVASTYLRGIKYIQIPTTLLAQVDSSIGGKTGFNLDCGKNLIGTFYEASSTCIDIHFLETLSESEFRSGLAEVIKYALINKRFFNFLNKNIDKILKRDEKVLKNMVERCRKIKLDIVEKDFKEKNIRKILNLGHSLGHAIETYKNYEIKHGEALATGLLFSVYLSIQLKLCDEFIFIKISELLNKCGFEILNKFEISTIIEIMDNDKKMADNQIDFIVVKEIGKVEIIPLNLQKIEKILYKWKETKSDIKRKEK